MKGTITPFVRASMNITRDLLNVLGDQLGLPAGTMDKLHAAKEVSGSETRTIKNPPVGQRNMSVDKVAIGAHTDFGSLVRAYLYQSLCVHAYVLLCSRSCITASAGFKFAFLAVIPGSISRFVLDSSYRVHLVTSF